jgi:transmembrane sensor
MTAQADKRASAAEAAADWFALRRSGRMTMQELFELEVWLENKPANLAAFKAVARTWTLTQALATDPEILAIREAVGGRVPMRRRMVAAGIAFAAAVVFAFGLYAMGIGGVWRDMFSPVSDQHYETAIGQTSVVTLPDGSTATLDTATTLDVHETWRKRAITLAQGQALFHVAKDAARPFTVSAGGNSVTATGTIFDVRVDAERFTVVLTEGRLHVDLPQTASAPAEQTDMVAGWKLTAPDNGERSLVRLSPDEQVRSVGWTRGQLAFVGQPLSVIADELNRYSMKKIVLSPGVAALPIDGVFRAGDIDGFARLLVRDRLVRVQKNTDVSLILGPRKKR